MISKLLKNSGFYLDKSEHNIIEKELKQTIKELELLEEYRNSNQKSKNYIELSKLRDDDIKNSFSKDDILLNSKSKNNDGFLAEKII